MRWMTWRALSISSWCSVRALRQEQYRTTAQESSRGVVWAPTPAPPVALVPGRSTRSEVPLTMDGKGGAGWGTSAGTTYGSYGNRGGEAWKRGAAAPAQRLASAPVVRGKKPSDTWEGMAWAGADAGGRGLEPAMAPHGSSAQTAFAHPAGAHTLVHFPA
jgi:hypothetical protein